MIVKAATRAPNHGKPHLKIVVHGTRVLQRRMVANADVEDETALLTVIVRSRAERGSINNTIEGNHSSKRTYSPP
jgi:hypothetical protein